MGDTEEKATFTQKRSLFEGGVVDNKKDKGELEKIRKQLNEVENEKSKLLKKIENDQTEFKMEIQTLKYNFVKEKDAIVSQLNGELGELLKKQAQLEADLNSSKEENKVLSSKMDVIILQLESYEEELKRGKMMELGKQAPAPQGEVTLVFTDVQGSTVQWEKTPKAMKQALRIHNDLMRKIFSSYGGYEVKTEGDAFMVSFASTKDAVKCCIEIQEQLLLSNWPEELLNNPDSKIEISETGVTLYKGLRIRVGIHVGTPDCEKDPVTSRMDYFGPMVNRSARVQGIAHAGQILISGDVWEKIKDSLPELGNPSVTDLGMHKLKGLDTDTSVRQLLPASLKERTFPPNNPKKQEETEKKPENNIRQSVSVIQEENNALLLKLEALQTQFEDLKTSAGALVDKVKVLKESRIEDPLIAETVREMERLVAEQDKLKVQMENVQDAGLKQGNFVKDLLQEIESTKHTLKNLENLQGDSISHEATIKALEAKLQEQTALSLDLESRLQKETQKSKELEYQMKELTDSQPLDLDSKLQKEAQKSKELESKLQTQTQQTKETQQKLEKESEKSKALQSKLQTQTQQTKELEEKFKAQIAKLEQQLESRNQQIQEFQQSFQEIKKEFSSLKQKTFSSSSSSKQEKQKTKK